MRKRDDSTDAGFTARVPAEHKAALGAIFPMTGGRKWAIETALEMFLDRCEADSNLVTRIHAMIEEYNSMEPPRGLEQLLPRVKLSLYQRFNALFGEKGATTWFIRTFLQFIVDEVPSHTMPEVHVERAVDSMLGLNTQP